MQKCLSCRTEINEPGSVSFKCPSCTNFLITRCRDCRERAVKYVCLSCGFSGPN